MPGPPADFAAAQAYLDSLMNYERTPSAASAPRAMGLERIARLSRQLGSPHRAYPCVHVAGTKGKGSVAAMAESVARAHGLTTGLYTSPHLVSVRERIALGGSPVSEEALVRALGRAFAGVERAREEAGQAPGASRRPTYFEVLTHLAFLAFAEARVDLAVVEVGMGGRLDATNVVRPEACAITPISLDHTVILGGTLSAIAAEKAGILKRGVPCVLGAQPGEALAVIEYIAGEVGAPLERLGREVLLEGTEGEFAVTTPEACYEVLRVPLWGRHQMENAAVAVRLVELAFARLGRAMDPGAVREGLAQVRWPGRIEKVADRPVTILDGAHNPDSIRRLVETLRARFDGARPAVAFGVASDKDAAGMLRLLAPWAGSLVATGSGHPRALAAEAVASAAREAGVENVEAEPAPVRALTRVRSLAGAGGLAVATGSLYLVGALKRESEARS